MKWWQNAAVYQVYPRSFNDSNLDGIGDLPGVNQKLDYLADLGIDAIWISPFYPSPLIDGGYDISDPRDVASDLGGLKAIDELIASAKSKGIKVIIDLVPNHVSSKHEWFIEAIESSPGSAARKRFHFQDGKGENGELPPNNWISLFGGPAWTQVVDANGNPGQWYLHLFDKSQPDLNWTNQEVIFDFDQTLRFWLDRGVAGFRVDVALGLCKDMNYPDDHEPQKRVDAIRLDLYDPLNQEASEAIRNYLINSPIFDRDEVHEIYRRWQRIFAEYDRDVLGVAEAWAYPTNRAMEYAKSLGQVFNFDFMVTPFDSEVLAKTIAQIVETSIQYSSTPTWVLSNHDASRVVSRFGGGADGLAKARSMAMLAHFLPGSIYVYQGEELGLEDVQIPPQDRKDPIWINSGNTQTGREGARAPITWSLAADQEGEPLSTLNLYQRLLDLRRTHPAWKTGLGQTMCRAENALLDVSRGQSTRCIVNTTDRPIDVPVRPAETVLAHSSILSDPEPANAMMKLPKFTAVILDKR
ncbi:MAG: hypothetical protein RLZZ571_1097 [Actinomycetota bacterium]|jgi:alpha-glucosidase